MNSTAKSDLVEVTHPLGVRWSPRRLALLAAVAALLIVLLWWVDPRQVPVPMCGLHTATGLHCPGCGATRATHELLHGRLSSALSYNALWVLVLPLALYTGFSEGLHFAGGRRLPGDLLRKPWFFAVVVVVAVLFGIVRNLPWEPFVLLTPP
jgi:hypothetical protein